MSVATPEKIRRQKHGIQVEQTTITLPGAQMARLRREAKAQGITVSRHVVSLIRLAWSVQGALSAVVESERESA